MGGLAVFFLFVIAMAVAPEAIINLCRLIEGVFRVVFSVVGLAACLGFFWWCLLR